MSMIMRTLLCLAVLSLMLPCSWSPAGVAHAEGPPCARVLLISSYHPGFPSFFKQTKAISDVFKPVGIRFDVEFMDSKRFPLPQDRQRFLSGLAGKLRQLPPYDVVMAADDNALTLVLEYRDTLLPDVPIVFLGINDVEKAMALDARDDVTGVIESISASDNLQTMASLFPERTNVHIVVDGTPSGQGNLRSVLALQKEFPALALKTISLEELSWEQLAAASPPLVMATACCCSRPSGTSPGKARNLMKPWP
jgi:hypothetical protein